MFTGQMREFPSHCGQLWVQTRQQRALLPPFSLLISATHPSPRLATCTYRLIDDEVVGAGGGSDSSSTWLTLHHYPASLFGPGPHLHHCSHYVRLFPPGLPQLARRLLRDGWASQSLLSFPFLCCFTRSAAGFSGAVKEIRVCACVCDAESEWKAAGADAEPCCWPAVSAGCVCRVQRSVWRCHHCRMPGSFLFPSCCMFEVEAERQTLC